MNTKDKILYFAVAVTVLLTLPNVVYAQKKGKKPAAKVAAAPKEDFSLYTNNPICKVLVADSVVVPSTDVIKNIPMPSHLGRFFVSPDHGNAIVYENEFADYRMFSLKNDEGRYVLYGQTLTGQKWSEPEVIRINGDFTDIINPFPMPDGQTLYFAARSMDDNDGKTYSLYTTTLNTETNEYLSPQRLPFPFASDADDLLYIEDETTLLAWLVSARRQQEGMVCIYVMQNKQPWTFYDDEETDPRKLKDYALISRIADTWTSETDRNKVLDELRQMISMQTVGKNVNEISTEQAMMRRIEETRRKLDEYRIFYNNADDAGKKGISSNIIELEQLLRNLYAEYRRLF